MKNLFHKCSNSKNIDPERDFVVCTDACKQGLGGVIMQDTYLFEQTTWWLEFLCKFDFVIKHIKGKENKVLYSLGKKMHEMHVVTIDTFQSDLRQ